MTAFYLAASYSRRFEMREHTMVLERSYNHTAMSSWIGQVRDEFASKELATTKGILAAQSHAMRDLRDIRGCDVFLLFTQQPSKGKGGSAIEFGYAFAVSKQVHVIGPRRNVFHAHPGIAHWADWDAFVEEYLAASIARQASSAAAPAAVEDA